MRVWSQLFPLCAYDPIFINLSLNFVDFQARNAYKKLMKDIAVLLGANKTGIDLMDQVYEFEKKLANV